MLNPKFSDFVEKKPNLTLVGLVWALGWRLYLLTLTIIFFATILVGFLSVIIATFIH